MRKDLGLNILRQVTSWSTSCHKEPKEQRYALPYITKYGEVNYNSFIFPSQFEALLNHNVHFRNKRNLIRAKGRLLSANVWPIKFSDRLQDHEFKHLGWDAPKACVNVPDSLAFGLIWSVADVSPDLRLR